MATESLFTTQTPAAGNESDGTPTITRGVTLEFAVAGYITGVRWWCPTTNTGTYTVAVWDLSGDGTAIGGVALATKVHSGTPTGGAWNVTTLDTPIAVTSAKTYRLGVNNSQGRYVASGGVMGSTITNGNVSAPGAGGTTKAGFATSQGTYNISSALTLPTSSFNSSNYFVDVAFSTTLGGSFTKDVVENYRVFTGLTKDVVERFRVTNGLSKDVVERFRVFAALTRDVVETYRVLGSLSKDIVERFRILNAFNKDVAEQYAILAGASFTKDIVERYRVFAGLSKDASEQYRIFNAFTRDSSETYRVLAPINKDVAERFRIYAALTKDIAEQYAILGGTSFNKDVVERYRLFATFSKDLAEQYRILTPLSKDTAERYRVLGGITRDLVERYRLYAGFSRDIIERYRVLSAIVPPPRYANGTAYLGPTAATADLSAVSGTAYLDEIDS